MSLINFLLYRKEEKSPLATRKYGENKVNPNELENPLLANKLSNKDNKVKSKSDKFSKKEQSINLTKE